MSETKPSLSELLSGATPRPWVVERARGYPEVCHGNGVVAKLGFESQMDILAEKLGMDPLCFDYLEGITHKVIPSIDLCIFLIKFSFIFNCFY